MTHSDIVVEIEKIAPLHLKADSDNAGFIIGNGNAVCNGVLLSLDVTEEVINEAISNGCNLIIAHHPIIFKGLNKINGNNYVEKTIVSAIKNDIAIYACHTNIDNVVNGVNAKIAQKIGLNKTSILMPKPELIKKLAVYVPESHVQQLEAAIFQAGAGHIGNYSECSFISEGIGSFKPEAAANPVSGKIGERSVGKEKKIEVVFPSWRENSIIQAMKTAHNYEEVAFEITQLSNIHQEIGAGMVGELPHAMKETDFLEMIKDVFNVKMIKHTALLGKMVKKVAVCGGAGSFLVNHAIRSKADFFITSDMKYHEFFDAENRIVIADIGHFESEQYTIELFDDVLRQKFPNFAFLKTKVNTNPVHYF